MYCDCLPNPVTIPYLTSKQYFSAEKCIVIVSPTQWQLEQQYEHQINLINV